jgi:DNA-binding NarL/FixJ family response regulator
MAAKPQTVGVLVLEPLRVVRSALVKLLSDVSDISVLADAGTADEALGAINALRRRSRVVVMVSLGLSDEERDADWLIRRIRDSFPTLRILGFDGNGRWGSISRALLEGADGYVDKNSDPEIFVESIRRTADGEVVLEGLPRDWLQRDGHGNGDEPSEPALLRAVHGDGEAEVVNLTEREHDVLELAAEALTARQMASRLGLRERTVTTHLEHIYRKLGVSSRVAAVTEAAKMGLVSIEVPA